MFKSILILCLCPLGLLAQVQTLPLTDLSAFKKTESNWKIVGKVAGNYTSASLQSEAGTGILLNQPAAPKTYGDKYELYSQFEHGDISLSLDFMLPKGANSGIYLQSRYELQLFDSWGVKYPKDSDCGAIYHRWDESRPEGRKGYEGHAPRQNASLAPGLWQHLDIQFQAPRFDASGKKIQNARFVKVVLNNILIHENIELLAPTRGATSFQETAHASLRIQGDHGAVAFKNISYELLDKQPISFGAVNYESYEGKFKGLDIGNAKPNKSGTANKPNSKLTDLRSDFVLVQKGDFNLTDAGEYTFYTQWTGFGKLTVDGETITDGSHWYSESIEKTKQLSAGKHQYVISYAKDFNWGPKALGFFIKQQGGYKQAIHERTSLPEPEPVGLVEVEPTQEPALQRCFMFHQTGKRTHAIAIGDPSGVNLGYDLDQNGILKIWKGKFLNTTQMWYERGEPQIGEPLGSPIELSGRSPLAILADANAAFPDSLNPETGLIYKGYTLDAERFPTFQFMMNGISFTDRFTSFENGKGLLRTIETTSTTANLYEKLAEGKQIETVADNLYLIDQKYYLQVITAQKPTIRTINGKQELIMTMANGETKYAIIW